jgi:hypothetical protein
LKADTMGIAGPEPADRVSEVSRVRPVTFLALAFLLAGLVCGVGPINARGATEPLPRVSFISAPGSSVLLHGIYPKVDSPCVKPAQPLLHSRFPGTVEIGRDTDGSLFVIGVLTVEQYLEGIAEVPGPHGLSGRDGRPTRL